MTLPSGTRIGAYEVLALLGSGGMGEVYRARDTRLPREVALKLLPTAFAADPDRIARFTREAHALASLTHPHIGAIYGIEDTGALPALVLELVEGQTLAEHIDASRTNDAGLAIAGALTIAGQIADALEAAHQKGIIHRDLKPANIKIGADGRAKVLDFGLAKADDDYSGSDLSKSPTVAIGVTHSGALLGTAPYMSPEQARGQKTDKRTDIWAFGCVLYEMLTGRRAFSGDTTTDVLAAIVERSPDWNALPAATPAAIRQLLKRCLEKDARKRLRDIGDARIELEDAQSGGRGESSRVLPGAGSSGVMWASAILVVVGAIVAAWALSRRGAEPLPGATRTTVLLPPSQELDALQSTAPLALSPDGRQIAYVASSGGSRRLYLRGLDAFDAKPLAGTDGAQYPFFSPDGQAIAFFADAKLKRVPIGGGAPTAICDVPRPGRGGTWGSDGTIVFSGMELRLMRVQADGGPPAPVVSHDSAIDARLHSWPQLLPDGRGLLSSVQENVSSTSSVAVLSFETGEWRALVPGSQAQYLNAGYLVYHAPHLKEGQVNAVAFDIATLAVRGSPVTVLDGAFRSANGGAAFFAVSPTGTLIFAPGGFARTLVQVDRSGRRAPIVDERRGFRFPRFSPDGRRIVVTVDPRPSQIWVYDVERGSRIPITSRGHNLSGVWTADGKRVAFTNGGILWAAADGSSPPELLLARPDDASNVNPTGWTADGRTLLFQQQVAATDYDIWIAPSSGKPKMIVSTPVRDLGGRLSPDGRWLAYYSNESGRHEVYVRPFPNVNDYKWTISTAGGWTPVWAPDGRELFYMNGASMMAVPIAATATTLVAGKPEFLFDGPFDTTQDENFDLTPDGKHFLMVEADPDAKPTKVNVVLNWGAEIERAVPAR